MVSERMIQSLADVLCGLFPQFDRQVCVQAARLEYKYRGQDAVQILRKRQERRFDNIRLTGQAVPLNRAALSWGRGKVWRQYYMSLESRQY